MTTSTVPGLADVPPVRLFGALTNAEWCWLNFDGRAQCPWVDEYLPSLPPEEVQESISGEYHGPAGLQHGFQVYRSFKQGLQRHGPALAPADSVLDFGCGWGRIIRFFIHEVEPQNLWGVDVSERAIEACRQTNRWASFALTEPLPPTAFDDARFALVYSYSVFSHLSEESHLAWLAEFERILRPGGVLIATTLTREYIRDAAVEPNPESLPEWARSAAQAFADPEELLAAYDRGEYCFRPTDALGEHFGLASIPEAYVRERWSRHFDVRDYARGPGQIVIVCRRPRGD